MKKCPFCAEDIQDDAIKCRYCGEKLSTDRDTTIPSSIDPAPRTRTAAAGVRANGASNPIEPSPTQIRKRKKLGFAPPVRRYASLTVATIGLVLFLVGKAATGLPSLGIVSAVGGVTALLTGPVLIRILIAVVSVFGASSLAIAINPNLAFTAPVDSNRLNTGMPASGTASPQAERNQPDVVFSRTWTTIPTEFKGDDYSTVEKASPSPKGEFETWAAYQDRAKVRLPVEWVFLDEDVSRAAKYDADKAQFEIQDMLSLGGSGGPNHDGTPRCYYYALHADFDSSVWERFEFSVPSAQAADLKPHLGLLWICKPFVGANPRTKTETEMVAGEPVLTTHLRIESVTDLWLLDMRTRSVLHKYKRVGDGYRYTWK